MVRFARLKISVLASLVLCAGLGQAQEGEFNELGWEPAWEEEEVTPPVTQYKNELRIDEVVLSPEQWLADMHRQAELALDQGRWAQGEALLSQALAEYPDDIHTRLKLASLLFGRGALSQAREQLQQGLKQNPEQADLRLSLARLLAEEQRYPAAFKVLSHASPNMSRHLDYYSLKADMARRADHCEQAKALYQELLNYNSVGSWWLGLGLCQRKLGENFTHAFSEARASADLGQASLRFVEQQLEQYETTQTH